MVLNKFKETIFVKEDSNLEKEINNLKALINEDNKSKIEYDIKLLELGLNGEKQIEYELKNSNIGMYVLHDITFKYEGMTAQVDYIIITSVYIYFVECKNLIGNISVTNTGEFRRDFFINNKLNKEAIYSPYTQVLRHKSIYEKLWDYYNPSIIDKTLRKNNIINRIKPLVVLANYKGLLNIKYAPKEIKSHTIRVDNLINYIRNDLKSISKIYYLNQKQMQDIANTFLKINIEGSTYISDKYRNADGLRNKLISFRKKRSIKNNIPAYYVFTNEELEKLVDDKPTSMEELKKILPSIKVKVHGEEIIRIIKENV